jgi:hypothetical protein
MKVARIARNGFPTGIVLFLSTFLASSGSSSAATAQPQLASERGNCVHVGGINIKGVFRRYSFLPIEGHARIHRLTMAIGRGE